MPIVHESNWHVRYFWSESSGLKLGRCEFGEALVIHSASVPFVYVNYGGDEFGPFTDELRSESGDVEIRDIVRGFDLRVRYDGYGPDYQYEHVWRFHSDGQFGSSIVIHGPGEELEGQHVYHVPFRFDLDLSGAGGDSFQRRVASGWEDVEREARQVPAAGPARDYDWRLADKRARRYALIRAGARDEAELWPLRYRRVESWGSWGPAGEGAPGSPGSVPAIYANDQSVQDTNVVVWYLAHVGSRELVAACGPWFRLQGYPVPADEDDDHDHDDHDHDDHDHDDHDGHDHDHDG